MFSILDGFVRFFSDRPGSYVVMFGPDGKRMTFRIDKSYFNDTDRMYVWAFEHKNEIKEKDTFLFVNAKYAVVGEVNGDAVHIVKRKVEVFCDEEGHPQRVLIQPVD